MSDTDWAGRASLLSSGSRVPTRSMSDVLGLTDDQRAIVHCLMRRGDRSLEDLRKEALPDTDPETVLILVGQLVEDGFVQVGGTDGSVLYFTRLTSRPGRQLSRTIWQVLYEQIADMFDSEGELIHLEGNRPLILDDLDAVWLVRSGSVNVFESAFDQGHAIGARRHLFSVATGQTLFSLSGGAGHFGFLALGLTGTTLRRVSRQRLGELAHEPRQREQVATLLGQWITNVERSLETSAPPRHFQDLDQAAHAVALPEQVLRVRAGVRFVTVLEGAVRFSGLSDIPHTPDMPAMPLTETNWLTVEKNARLAVSTLAQWLEHPRWSQLDAWHRQVLAAAMRARDAHGHREQERIVTKAGADGRAMSGAVAQLASLLGPSPASMGSGLPGDALVGACRLVTDALGASLPAHQGLSGEGNRIDAVSRIARQSHLRARQVLLRDQWWKQDSGPLLGWMENGDPVALIPDRHLRYERIDPRTGARVWIGASEAERLQSTAITFARPFPDRLSTLRDLLVFGARGLRRDFGMVLLMGIVSGILATVSPILTGQIFSHIIPGANRAGLAEMIGALLAVAVVGVLFQLVRGIALLRIEGKMDNTVQSAVWDRLLKLPATFFREYTAGDLTNRAMGINAIRQMLTGSVLSSIMSGIFSIFSFALLFFYSTRLALAATVLTLAFVGVTWLYNWRQIRLQRVLMRLQGKLAGAVLELITGVVKLRSAGAETRAFARWAQMYREQRLTAYRARQIGNEMTAFDAAFPAIGTLVIYAAVGLDARSALSVGAFIAFTTAFSQFVGSVISLSSSFMSLTQVIPIYERARPIFQATPEVDGAKAEPGELTGDIEVSHLRFRYRNDGPATLDDLSFRVRPGEFVALVGPSGSGKSTIMRILLAFDKPESGSVFFDGQDLNMLDVAAVRRQIGVVLQNGRLIQGDIFTNIVGASTSLTLDDAWEAARMAGLEPDIQRMPMGMHTYLSVGGGTLSGGQRQRLMIARAIVHKPRILLFDEATSALDNRTQAIVSESLESLRATRIVIAHRLSTVINADRIFVVENGRIVQSGMYEELAGQAGVFAELIKRQLA